jgi:hypothetical protein
MQQVYPLAKHVGDVTQRERRARPYIDFAARMEGIDYEEVTAEMRQIAKAGDARLRLWTRRRQVNPHGKVQTVQDRCVEVKLDAPECAPMSEVCAAGSSLRSGPTKPDLWRYAEMMGIELSAKTKHTSKLMNSAWRLWTCATSGLLLKIALPSCTITRRKQHSLAHLVQRCTLFTKTRRCA